MSLVVYNTLTRQKEPFETIEEGKVRLYVCGPTVYDRAHVGHAMSSIVFDVIRRYLEHKGLQVDHIMNYTDVEDKVIQRANELGVGVLELAESYIHEYDRHLKDLNILPAKEYPRASEEIDFIVKMVKGLVESGYAYSVDGDVYFRVGKDEDYGKLSRRRLEDMRSGARLEIDERKDDPADFALWKSAKPGEPSWDSPWGQGRPGWHIECSAMNLHYLGEEIDIHGGGNDLVFPHHENEIAQSESFTGRPFARFWLHNGMLQLKGEKMSKSLGNLVPIEDFLKANDPDVFRLLVLNSHYRSPLTYNDKVVAQASQALERIRSAFKPASPASQPVPDAEAVLEDAAEQARQGFGAAMDDDFNTAGALSHLFEFVRSINQARDAGASAESMGEAQAELRRLAGVLGLQLTSRSNESLPAAPFVDLLVEIREKMRQDKQWDISDQIRDRLADLGILLEDGKDGTTWRAE